MFLGIWAWDQEFNFSLMSAGLNPSFGGGGGMHFITNISHQSLQIKNKGEGVVCRCDEGEVLPTRYLENFEIFIKSILLVVENND